MLQKFLARVFGTKNERELKKIRPLVEHIRSFEAGVLELTDDQLRGRTLEFRARLENGATLDDLLPEAFATVREAGKRTLGQRHYDVQMIGGYALHKGIIAEMRTGEGKTLVATLPAYLNALAGRGVHVVTVNDYLARRDCEWMGQIYRFLGLSTGVVTTTTEQHERRAAYLADITYGQNNELGFDYLRDNMKYSLDEYVHRFLPTAHSDKADKLLAYGIVDEVDSILIDEARTPLIISGFGEDTSEPHLRANTVIPFLKRDLDYIVDEKNHSVALTESGIDKVEARLKIGNLYDTEHMHWTHYIHAALKAHTLFRNEVTYLVEDGKIVIIDEHTGRKMPGRRWSDGIHQAIEAKEGVRIQQESQTLATITFQNYFRMYEKLCGMTGTAETEAEEFAKIYNLDVLVIPTNKPIVRQDHEDVIFKTERAKFKAVFEDVEASHEKGQPVLVGTISVEKSQFLSDLLTEKGIPHDVLNAKNHAREADIVAQAGRFGAVTIATNMAGRGTDIVLGGNPELLARSAVFGGGGAVHQAFDENDPAYLETLAALKVECAAERLKVVDAGGVYIIGTERHESRRIDNQLRGRSGRQGDPGESCFYLSLDDDLMRVFGGDRVRKIMEWLKIPEDEPIIAPSVTKAIGDAQKRLEGQHFDSRKNVLDYDDVMNLQRKAIYALRRRVLAADDTQPLVRDAVRDLTYKLVDRHCPDKEVSSEWDLGALEDAVFTLTQVDLDLADVNRDFDSVNDALGKALADDYHDRRARMVDQILHTMDAPEGTDPTTLAAQAEKHWAYFEREAYLRGLDTHWRDHLRVMEALKEGVYLEAYAQKDPKIIYKKEGFQLFLGMVERIQAQLVEAMFRVEVKSSREIDQMRRDAEARRARARAQVKEVHETHGLHDEAAAVERGAAQRGPGPAGGRPEHMRSFAARAAAAQRQQRAAAEAPAALLDAPVAVDAAAMAAAEQAAEQAAGPTKVETFRRERPKVGRNDPCWCGSGQKYKKCHMAQDEGTPAQG
ncbi:MAG: preprotein translocase subunit SecA [Myxococcales bacterium]|nr:preprotein translocase subunit SecA [Myxococcales bacterium]